MAGPVLQGLWQPGNRSGVTRDGGVSDKSGWEGRSQQFRDSRWGRQGPVPSPWTQPKKNSALEPLEGCIVWGCWELKGRFPVMQ
jgi:hypothetical protein